MIFLQYLLPHHLINKLANIIGNCSIPWIKNFLIRIFLKCYAINLDDLKEYEHSNPFAYKTYNAFFTRKLKPNARLIDSNYSNIISPADGIITQHGIINNNLLINVKGSPLILENLLGSQHLIKCNINPTFFSTGKFITIYLAPHNYHRIHMPVTATLDSMIYIPGKLFSVRRDIIEKIPNVFTKNERVIVLFNSSIGKFAVVLVGAMIVGSIITSWHGSISPTNNRIITSWQYDNTKTLHRGAELGLFQLGSTVILLFENNAVNFNNKIYPEATVKMGTAIASY